MTVPIQILKKFELFEGLNDEQLEKIATICHEETYEVGTIFWHEGDSAENLYLLWQGSVALDMEVQVFPSQPVRRRAVEVLVRGEPFGWSSMAEPHRRTLSAKALEASRTIVIDGPQLHTLLDSDPQMGYVVVGHLVNLVSSRLRETRERMTELLREGEVAREYAPEESMLVEGMHNFIKFRWLAATGVFLLALLARGIFGIEFPLLPVLAVGGAILLYNLLFWFSARRLKGEMGPELVSTARRFAYAQSISDLLAITILVHYTGGIENPFIFYYVFHVIIACVLLSPRIAYALATLAPLLLGSLVGLEYLGVIPHVHLGGFVPPALYRQGSFTLAMLFALATTLYVGCYLTLSISGELRRRQWEIVALKNRLLEEAREMEEANRELLRLDRLKTYFLAMASHDLKTPLAAVQSYLQVMLGGFAGEITQQQRHMMERSSVRIQELFDLINRFLDFAHIEGGEIVQRMEMTSLEPIIDGCVEEMNLLALEKDQALVVERPSFLPEIYVSPSHLQQVLINLLSNAIKFTPQGGRVTLEVGALEEDIRVTVTDTGMGIDPEDMPRIFEDFYRGKGAGKGTGLGLSIAKRIVEAHQGEIWAESPYAEGQPGSRFTFVIPQDLRKRQAARESSGGG